MLTRGNTVFDVERHTVATPSGAARLTRQQCELLVPLFRSPGMVSHDALMGIVWFGRDDGPLDSILSSQICYIRAQLRRVGSDLRIACAWREGYRLIAPDEQVVVRTYTAPQIAALTRAMEIVRKIDPALVASVEGARA